MTVVCLRHITRPNDRVFYWRCKGATRQACFLLARLRPRAADKRLAASVMPRSRCRFVNHFSAKKPCLPSQSVIFENKSHCYQGCCARRLRQQVRLRNMPDVESASYLLGASPLAKASQSTSGVKRCFDRWRTHQIIRNVWELTAGTAARF